MSKALSLILDASRALIWAERHAIVHRDVKPDNFLIDRAMEKVYLIDFGLSVRMTTGENVGPGVTSFLGTRRYASAYTHVGFQPGTRDDIICLTYSYSQLNNLGFIGFVKPICE